MAASVVKFFDLSGRRLILVEKSSSGRIQGRGQNEGFLIAEARRTGGGKSVFFAEGEVLTPDRRVIATASGVFKPGRPPKLSV